MNKKGNILEISAYAMVFSFISIFFLFLAVLNYAIINDYVIYNMQNVTDTLANQSIISNTTQSYLQARADEFRTFNFNFDNLWFLAYMIFIISSFILAYQTRPSNYFGFLSMLFYGMMVILFVLTIYQNLTNWFNTQILLQILPNVVILLPKFYYYLDHIGIFTALQLAICMIINLVDFDFSRILARKKQESDAVQDDEVV